MHVTSFLCSYSFTSSRSCPRSSIILTGLVWHYNVIRTSKNIGKIWWWKFVLQWCTAVAALSLSPFFKRVKSIEVLIMRLDWGVRESAGFGNYVHADRTLILHTHSTAQLGNMDGNKKKFRRRKREKVKE